MDTGHFYLCLSDLSPRSVDAFVYREVDGLSTEEICKRLSITANNCWVMLYRARVVERKCLELFGFSRQNENNIITYQSKGDYHGQTTCDHQRSSRRKNCKDL